MSKMGFSVPFLKYLLASLPTVIAVLLQPAAPLSANVTGGDSPGTLQFTATSFSVSETELYANVAISRVGGSAGNVSVRCRTSDGTAVAGEDYWPADLFFTWRNGDTHTQTCRIRIFQDIDEEPDETLELSLVELQGTVPGDPIQATLTIFNDDADEGKIQFVRSSTSIDEDTGSARLFVERVDGSRGRVTATCSTSDGTAVAGEDYIATSQVLTWVNTDTSQKACDVTILDETMEEENEFLRVTLSNFTGDAVPGNPVDHELVIVDEDDPGDLSFTAGSYSVVERHSSPGFAVQRTGGKRGVVSVTCTTSDLTATAGEDYRATTQVLQWGDNKTTPQMCIVPVYGNTVLEGTETFRLTLSDFTGGAEPGTTTQADVEIREPGFFKFSSTSYTFDEEAGTVDVPVQRLDGVSGDVTLRCRSISRTAVAGEDFSEVWQTLHWPDGDGSDKICTLPIFPDCLVEGDETLQLNLSGSWQVLEPRWSLITITDTPPPAAGHLKFTADAFSTNEGSDAVAGVTRFNGSEGPVSVTCATAPGTATADVDYDAAPQVVHWEDGETGPRNCVIPVVDDALVEADETFQLSLSDPTGGTGLCAPPSATLTLLDDDAAHLSFADALVAVEESAGIASIAVTRSRNLENAVSVRCNTSDGTATAGADYTATSALLQWRPGQGGSRTCTVPILEDAVLEAAPETIQLSLADLTGGAVAGSLGSATIQILPSDRPGTLGYTQSSFYHFEPEEFVFLSVRRTEGSTGAVSATCQINSPEEYLDDFEIVSDRVEWADGETGEQACVLRWFDDDLAEPERSLRNFLKDPTGGASIGAHYHSLIIIDDELYQSDFERGHPCTGQGETEPDPCRTSRVYFDEEAYAVNEDAGTVSIPVLRQNRRFTAGMTVYCATGGGTATPGEDYLPTSQALTWDDDEYGPKTCTVSILDDAVQEGNETIELELALDISAPQGTSVGPASTVLTVVDED